MKGEQLVKVSIITLHRVFNYGSVLQAYATQKIFEDLGYSVEIIDYITEQRRNKRIFATVPDSINNIIHKYIYLFFKVFSILIKKYTFGRFLKRYVNLSNKKYITYHDLVSDPPQADIYVTGSDQVWNSNYNEGIDKGFFLEFAPNEKKKISFVASFGKTHLDRSEKEVTKTYLKKYNALSVREDCAIDILNDLGYYNCTCLIDPTLQVKKEHWEKLASKRLVKENYLILMLLYNEDNGATQYARKIADEKGLKLVKISWELKKNRFVDILMTHRSPEDFLSLFKYADFVVTNSFHGLAFSINLNKQFIVVPRKEYNSRIESLLRLTGLEERMVTSAAQLSVTKSMIDYTKVNHIIEAERLKAIEFIKESIEGGKQ